MTTQTRQAIAEMRKRGFSGEDIIYIASAKLEGHTPAQVLVKYVNETPNTRHCPNCHGAHHIQQCGEIRAAMAGASNGFLNRLKGGATR